MKSFFLLLSAFLCLLVVSAEAATPAKKPVCLTHDKLTNQMTPLDLFASYDVCMRQGRIRDAGYLFFVAAAYDMYDTQRVPDTATHEVANNFIKNIMAKQSQSEQSAFNKTIEEMMAMTPEMVQVCQRILALGPPMYVPIYMVGESDAYIKTEDLDVPVTWLGSVGATTRCPVQDLQLHNKTFKP